MIVVFALLVLVTGQPYASFAPQNGARMYRSQRRQGPPVGSEAAAAPAPTQFDIDQQRMNVRSERYLVEGNEAIYNLGFLPGYASIQKVRGSQIQVRRIRRAKQHLLSSGNPDPNALDDLSLQRVAAENQVDRRQSELLGSTPLPSLFEGRAHQAQLQLARNARQDAAQAFAKDPSRDNWLKLQNARDDIEQQQQWLEANKFDVFGFSSDLGDIAPLKRLQASRTALDTARRDRREIRSKYATNPTEDNWWDMRLNSVRIQALEEDIEANKGEAIFKLGTLPSVANFNIGVLLQAQSFDEEEQLWQRYHRLSLRNLQRKQAGVSGANPVQAQLLALNNYGPAVLPPVAV